MFTSIARSYDLLNHVLSMNIDRRWRAALVPAAGVDDTSRILDVATGTGDVAVEFARRSDAALITGLDPSVGMLDVAREKLARRNLNGRIGLTEGDALALPFGDGTLDVVTIAFGLRNLPDYGAGIAEMARVLRPGGRLLVLEFFPPRRGLFLRGYRFYLGTVLPVAGRIISGSREAYRYLAHSIETFIAPDDLRAHMTRARLGNIEARRLTGGIASIYRGVKQ